LLAYRSHSEAELRSRLQRAGFDDRVTEAALERLRSLHYINDEAFARNWATSAQKRGFGSKRIEQELTAKGISEALAREAIRESFGGTDETEHAKKLLRKTYKGKNLKEPKTLRRAAAFLDRRGYSESVIAMALREYSDDN
jgi:regulatory protein